MPELVTLGSSDLRVSRLAIGTFNFGHVPSGCDEATSLAIVRRYLELGYNYIDTANVYGDGRAEAYAGKALSGRRHEVVLASKAGGATGPGPLDRGTSRKALTTAIEASLKRLGTDYLDLCQMHVWDPFTPLEETLSMLDALVRAGKIRYAGVSNWTAVQIVDAVRLCEMHGLAPIISLQPQYNPLQRDIEVDIIPTCQRLGLGVVTWSPLAGGLLGGI